MTEPGVYPDMSDVEYHAHRDYLSSSGAKLLLPPSVPAKFRYRMEHEEHKQHFDFGKLCHALILGKGSDIVMVDAKDWRTKAAKEAQDEARAAGKIPVLAAEFDQALAIEDAVRSHPIAGDLLLSGDPELSCFTTDPDTGVGLRARPDWMTLRDDRAWIVDLKTAADANPDTFGRTAVKWGYHIQFAWYVTVARLLELDESPAFVFVIVEKQPPYLVSVCELDMEAYQVGKKQMRAAINIYKQCSDAGAWPGYPPELHPVSLPLWAIPEEEITVL